MELKAPTTFEEQVKLLRDKNIIIKDEDSCINFLSKVNYYRLSGYYLPFIRKHEEKCFISIDFERIMNIYYFDAKLRNLISSAIEEIEIYLRTQLSYYHAHKYGAEGYIDSSTFGKWHNHQKFMKHIQTCIYENKNTLVVKHQLKNNH